jgi:DNA-binding transcriptional LysR family regulator
MNNLDLLRPVAVFQAVVAQGSFRAAADSLGLSPPYVSQMISDLEVRLGRQLLYRSTRKIALTEAGEAFLPHAAAIADAFQRGLDSMNGEGNALSGRLRVTAPTVASGPRFARVVAQFTQAHPDVALDITLDDTVLDPVATRVDLAIRIGDPGDDPRLARKLFETRGVICCAPEQAKSIKDVEDLSDIFGCAPRRCRARCHFMPKTATKP